jgi:hypothetical protein
MPKFYDMGPTVLLPLRRLQPGLNPRTWIPKASTLPLEHRSLLGPRLTFQVFCNTIRFYGEELLVPRPTPKLENHPLSAVRDCLFNIFAATLHIEGSSSIRNLRTRHAVVTGTNLYRPFRGYVTEV